MISGSRSTLVKIKNKKKIILFISVFRFRLLSGNRLHNTILTNMELITIFIKNDGNKQIITCWKIPRIIITSVTKFDCKLITYHTSPWLLVPLAGGNLVHLFCVNLFLAWLGKVLEVLNIINKNQCTFR